MQQDFSAKVFSQNTFRNSDGEITIGGVTVTDLAKKYGTPLYVIDEQDAHYKAEEIKNAFTSSAAAINTTVKIYYAGKAFLCTEVANWMADAGLNIDVCSGGELAVALAAGIDPEKIAFHGNNKSDEELVAAISSGIGTIILDSFDEVARVAKYAKGAAIVQRVRLRVKSGVHASTHEFLATSHEDQKFGVTLKETPEVVAEIRKYDSLEFLGLHCHIGSQIFSAKGFAQSAEKLIAVQADLLKNGPVPELNLGGGFGIAYLDSDEPEDIASIAEKICESVAKSCAKRGIDVPVLVFEPGRSIIGRAGTTLYKVGVTKKLELAENKTRCYISVDGGMSDNPRPALYDAKYSAVLASRLSQAHPTPSRIVGKHCETGDIIIKDINMPEDTSNGDILAVAATGAYCWSLASNYNYLARPAVVSVKEGESKIIVRGETISDLLSRDVGVNYHNNKND